MPQASALSLIMHLRSREACTLAQPQNTNHHTHRLDLGQTLGRCRGCGCRLRRPPVALFWCSAPPALRSSRRQRPNFFLVKNCLVFAPPFVPPNKCGIGTGISEASKRVPIFPFATQGGKQASSYFRQRNWVQAREAQIRFPAG